jgi:hypothetical protein
MRALGAHGAPLPGPDYQRRRQKSAYQHSFTEITCNLDIGADFRNAISIYSKNHLDYEIKSVHLPRGEGNANLCHESCCYFLQCLKRGRGVIGTFVALNLLVVHF